MERRKATKGQCLYCKQEMSKAGMPKHLANCSKRREVIVEAEKKFATRERLYHLRARDTSGDFWLDLEMPGSATLGDLDHYLRRIWLECCDHMSQFSFGGWKGEEISMAARIDHVFRGDSELTHIYDFGTETRTLIKPAAVREGSPTNSRPVALMARNFLPAAECIECGNAAVLYCQVCLMRENRWKFLCDQHARTHSRAGGENAAAQLPIPNSPRVGECGYNGPANPPY